MHSAVPTTVNAHVLLVLTFYVCLTEHATHPSGSAVNQIKGPKWQSTQCVVMRALEKRSTANSLLIFRTAKSRLQNDLSLDFQALAESKPLSFPLTDNEVEVLLRWPDSGSNNTESAFSPIVMMGIVIRHKNHLEFKEIESTFWKVKIVRVRTIVPLSHSPEDCRQRSILVLPVDF